MQLYRRCKFCNDNLYFAIMNVNVQLKNFHRDFASFKIEYIKIDSLENI